jgi:hypothetical protein
VVNILVVFFAMIIIFMIIERVERGGKSIIKYYFDEKAKFLGLLSEPNPFEIDNGFYINNNRRKTS